MTCIYTLTSALHDPSAIDKASKEFLAGIFPDGDYTLNGEDYSDFGSHLLDLIFVRTGGTEGIFIKLLPELEAKGVNHFYLLTSGGSNSLAASMEILSYLNQRGLSGEILHGGRNAVAGRIAVARALHRLHGLRLGVLGKPSDWLISSAADYGTVREKLGIEIVDIPMEEVCAAVASNMPSESDGLPGAEAIYKALGEIVNARALDGFTIRCFDLLTAFRNTGCLALARFNAEGIPAGCEGDVPALLAMTLANALTDTTGFMANPSRIDAASGRIVFAHCTVPLNMVSGIEYDTHFESGLGIGIRGHIPEGPVTIFKVSGDLRRAFAAEGEIVRNLREPNLCRTQIEIQLDDPSLVGSYFLSNPIGNHHIIVPGRVADELLSLCRNS